MTRDHLYIIAILILLIFGISQCEDKNHLQEEVNVYELDSYLSIKKSKEWKSKDSLWRSEVQTLETTLQSLKESKQTEIQDLIKKIEGLKKAKNIQSITLSSSRTRGSFQTEVNSIVNINCDHKFNFIAQDEWSNFQGNYDNGILSWDYEVNDSISYTTYWKRPGFLKSKKLFTQALSHNPNTKITGLKNINVRIPKPYIQISVGLSAYYDKGVNYVPAIHVGIPIITILSK